MKRRRVELWIFLFLIALPTNVLTRGVPETIDESTFTKLSLQHRSKRQNPDILQTIMQLGSKLVPLVQTFFSGGGGGAPQAAQPPAELSKLPTLEAGTAKPDNKVPEKPTKADDKIGDNELFSWSNLLSVGVKVALALLSNYSSGGLDRNGNEISPVETVMGTLISAMTGSEDPNEVSVMAKQATEVVQLFGTLMQALKTSFLS